MDYGGEEIDYWATREETGEWGKDNWIGRQYADILIAEIAPAKLPLVLVRISEAIVKKGRHEGIEVGFFNRIGEVVTSHAHTTEKSKKLEVA